MASRDLRIITTTFERIGCLIHHAPNRLYILLVDIRPVDGGANFPNTESKFNRYDMAYFLSCQPPLLSVCRFHFSPATSLSSANVLA
jgi:hypothetical protein